MCSIAMAYPAYVRERARELRTTKHLSLNEIAERLALPKTTVYDWINDLPLGRARRPLGSSTEAHPSDAKQISVASRSGV
jgi:predicted DNA-binding transcriptional regulator AlpA